MRVFVVGTGRCGTSTFYQACRHIENYTCGHETAAGRIELPEYPDGHIEVAAHLSMRLGELLRVSGHYYPDDKYVLLRREKSDCVRSLASQQEKQLRAWAEHWSEAADGDVVQIAEAFYDCINENVETMLRATLVSPGGIPMSGCYPDWQGFYLDNADWHWTRFWDWIGAEGDFEASLAEWERRYNPAEKRGRDNWVSA